MAKKAAAKGNRQPMGLLVRSKLQLIFYALIFVFAAISLLSWYSYADGHGLPSEAVEHGPDVVSGTVEDAPRKKKNEQKHEKNEPAPMQVNTLKLPPGALSKLADCLCKCFTHKLTGPERPHEFLDISSSTQCYGDGIENLGKLRRWVADHVRVFMYNMGTKSEGKVRGVYNVEANFYNMLESSEFRTRDVSRANLFQLPLFPSDYRRNVGSRGVAEECRGHTQNIAKKYSQFVAMGGRNHFFVSGRDQGKPCCLAHQPLGEMMAINGSALVNTADPYFKYGTWSRRRKRLYGLVPSPQKLNQGEAIFSQYNFMPARDVSLPCTMDEDRADEAWKALPDDATYGRRKALALFAGNVERVPLRLALNKSVGGQPGIRMVSGRLPPEEYREALLTSTFCLCPKGAAVWSPRLMEAIWHGCIPVIVADHYWVPFSCFFNWKEIAVFVPEKEVPTTYQRMKAVNDKMVVKMQKALRHIRRFLRGNKHTLQQIMTELFLKQQVCPWKLTPSIFSNTSDPSADADEEKREAAEEKRQR